MTDPRGHGHSGHSPTGGHGGPPKIKHVELAESRARIEFDWGELTATATATELMLVVRADDPHALATGQALIAGRLETIGRRDDLTVRWAETCSD